MTTEVLGTNTEAAEPWIPTDEQFGARLALIRQRMNWGNVKEAALACGIAVESWRSWERDNVSPRDYMAVCRRISERTGCNLPWLVGGSTLMGGPEHKILFARSAVRPADNRPAGGPRKGDDRGEARRPARIRTVLGGNRAMTTGSDLRDAA